MNGLIKFLAVSGLVACIFFSSATKSIIRISYEINKLEIIQKFCINKEVTEFKCDGKCYLKSQLEKADTEKEDIPAVKDHKIQLFQIAFRSIRIIPNSSRVRYFEFEESKTEIHLPSLLRPPIV